MKNLKLYNLHTNYLNNKAHIQLSNDIYPYASSCLDDMDLHIDKGYEIINYIENNSTAGIYTSIPFDFSKCGIEIKYLSYDRWANAMPAASGNSSYYFWLYWHEGGSSSGSHNGVNAYFNFGSSGSTYRVSSTLISSANLEINVPYIFKSTIDSSYTIKFYSNGSVTRTYTVSSSWLTQYNSPNNVQLFTLFGRSSTGTSYSNNFKGRVYYVKMWDENNIITHYLLPIRTTNIVGTKRYGFVDACTGKTYFSSTSVEFTGG